MIGIPLSPEHMPREGHFFGRRLAKSLRTSRSGFEGFGWQAKPRPAECRRISLSPPMFRLFPIIGDGHLLDAIDHTVPITVSEYPQAVVLEVPKSKYSL
jgi:hypothetical protein